MYPDNMSLVFLIIMSVYSYYYYHYVIMIYIYITGDLFLLLLLFLIPWIEWTNVAWKVYFTTIYGRPY